MLSLTKWDMEGRVHEHERRTYADADIQKQHEAIAGQKMMVLPGSRFWQMGSSGSSRYQDKSKEQSVSPSFPVRASSAIVLASVRMFCMLGQRRGERRKHSVHEPVACQGLSACFDLRQHVQIQIYTRLTVLASPHTSTTSRISLNDLTIIP